MDETSETESQGRNSKVDEDGSTIPSIITDEYFEEIANKCRAVSLNQQFSLSIWNPEFIWSKKKKYFENNCRPC